MLTAAECKKANFGRKADDIDYSRLYAERGRLLRLAYSRSDIGHNETFTAFCEKNKWWLDDFALFMAVKGRFEGKRGSSGPRYPSALAARDGLLPPGAVF